MSFHQHIETEHDLYKEFLFNNREKILWCPYQEGNLLISKDSCMARRLRAEKEALTDLMKGDIGSYLYRKGLSICLKCELQ